MTRGSKNAIRNTGHLSKAEQNEHKNCKDRARTGRELDKDNALKDKCITLCVDLKSLKLAPHLVTRSIYYKI